MNDVEQIAATQYQFENINQDLHLTVSFTIDEEVRVFSMSVYHMSFFNVSFFNMSFLNVSILNGLGALSLALCLSFLAKRKRKEKK